MLKDKVRDKKNNLTKRRCALCINLGQSEHWSYTGKQIIKTDTMRLVTSAELLSTLPTLVTKVCNNNHVGTCSLIVIMCVVVVFKV